MHISYLLPFYWYTTRFLLGNATSIPGPGEVSLTVPLLPTHMDRHPQTIVPRPLRIVAGLIVRHTPQAGCAVSICMLG